MKPLERTVALQDRARQGVLWGILILVLVGVSGLGIWSLLNQRLPVTWGTWSGASPRLPVYGSVPDFSLRDRNGGQVQLSDLRGKIWIANFIFTNCPDECPLMTAELSQVQTDFSSAEDLLLVSITVDPERDTLEVLSRYAERFGADPKRWLFLTGEKESIYRLARLGFRLSIVDPNEESQHPETNNIPSERSDAFPNQLPHRSQAQWTATTQSLRHMLLRLFEPPLALAHHRNVNDPGHSARFSLVDRRGRIRGYYDSREAEALRRLRQHVKALLREE